MRSLFAGNITQPLSPHGQISSSHNRPASNPPCVTGSVNVELPPRRKCPIKHHPFSGTERASWRPPSLRRQDGEPFRNYASWQIGGGGSRRERGWGCLSSDLLGGRPPTRRTEPHRSIVHSTAANRPISGRVETKACALASICRRMLIGIHQHHEARLILPSGGP